jgi:hypothetical protein
VLAVIDQTGGVERIDSSKMARITGYYRDATAATFTCETPSGQPQPFTPGGVPVETDTVVVLAPDPFDPRGLYPDYINISTPAFALYPLVYSAGPDKAFGVVSDVNPEDAGMNPNPEFPLTYTAVGLNPCFVPTVGTEMMGTFPATSGEPGFYVGCWNDNIHNHLLNMR